MSHKDRINNPAAGQDEVSYHNDVFICYAREDREAATELFKALLDRGLEPFFDKHSLMPGDIWPLELPAAQRNSQLTAVIVAEIGCGYYNVEEQITGAQSHRVVPIYLPGRGPSQGTVSYGLQQRVPIFLEEKGTWSAVAKELHRVLEHQQQNAPTVSHQRRRDTPIPTRRSSLSERIWNQIRKAVDSTGSTADSSTRYMVARKSPRKERDLQKHLFDRVEPRLRQRINIASYPLLIRLESTAEREMLADPRQLLRMSPGIGRVALLGETGSGRHSVAGLLASTLADAAEATFVGREHFASHLGELFVVVVSVYRCQAGESVKSQFPPELQRLLVREPQKIGRCLIIALFPDPVQDLKGGFRTLDYFFNDPTLFHCPNQLLVAHVSTRKLLRSDWDIVTLGGVHLERIEGSERRERFQKLMAWSAIDHLPVELAQSIDENHDFSPTDFGLALIRYHLKQYTIEETPAILAPFLFGRTLPSLFSHAYNCGDFSLSAVEIVDLYKSQPSMFPEYSRSEDVFTLLTRLPFLMCERGSSLVIVPSALSAELTASGIYNAQLQPRMDATSFPFEFSVRTCWVRISRSAQIFGVPRLVSFVHSPDASFERQDLIESAREISSELIKKIMHSHLSELIAALLIPIIEEPEATRLLQEMNPITRAIWAFDVLTSVPSLPVSKIHLLLKLIEPGYCPSLLAMAPNRRTAFIEAASQSPDHLLLERHLGWLKRTWPSLLPAKVVDRLNRPIPTRSN